MLAVAWSALTALAAPVDFAREIQPLLADKCYDCHGPEKAKGGLRLTARPEALRGGESGEPAIVVGHGAKSPLIQRLTTAEPDDVMPQKGARLSDAEVKLLQRWIDEGAVWPENVRHWAYVAPVRPAVPSVGAAWPAAVNAIDAFVFNRLQREGLRPSPAADKSRWLRRVSLDLTGLPPTPVERAAFLADDSPGSDERVVDRLLASPAYGERWARPWLDLARYADSHGFQRDDLRDLWPYRDWVIRALNADMPFDQFTTWQLAGDLVPEAKAGRTLEPLVATGFHRAAPTNVEAGTDQEEGRVNQVFDRVNTTGAVWLGTTLECAQCHNHKYDPFSQKDYYRLFAYFNQAEQETEFASAKAMATLKFTGPYLTLPDPTQETKRPALETRAAELEARIAARTTELATRQEGWEKVAAKAVVAPAQEHVLTVTAFESVGEASYRILPDQSVLIVDDVPETDTYYLTVNTSLTDITGFKLEALTDPSLPGTGPGRGDAARPNFVLNNVRVTATPPGGTAQPVIFVQARASFAQAKFPVENLLRTDNEAKGGWAISPQFKRDHWAVLTTERPLGDAGGVTFTFCLEQNFGAARTIGRVRLSALTGGAGGVAVTADVAAILRLEKARRTKAQAAKVQEYFFASDRDLAALKQAKVQVGQALAALAGVRTLVMREVATTRPTAVLKRGNFLDQGEAVSAGVPAALHPAPIAPAGNRLDLARWLVDRSNPLVARVTINRWWAEFFGRGIVPTLEDFGVKGGVAHASRIARLAGRGVHGSRLEREACAPVDRVVGDVPAVVARDAGNAGAGRPEPLARARTAVPPRRRSDPRQRARGCGPAQSEAGWTAGAALPAARPLGQQGRRGPRHLRREYRRGRAPPRHLYGVEAQFAVSEFCELRRQRPDGVHGASLAFEYAAAGADASERSGVRGSGPGVRAAHPAGAPGGDTGRADPVCL